MNERAESLDKLIEQLFADRELFAFNGTDSQSPLDYIHPWRRDDLETLIKNMPEAVEMLIVYGSSLGDFLRNDSDLDLAVVSKDRSCFNSSFLSRLGLSAEIDVQIFPSLEEIANQAEGFFPTPRAIITEGLPIYVKNMEIEIV